MNSDKSDDANEKSRAIDIVREDGGLRRIVSKGVDEGFEGRRSMDGSNEHKTDHAADFMDSIIRACCLCSNSLPLPPPPSPPPAPFPLDIVDRCTETRRDGKVASWSII